MRPEDRPPLRYMVAPYELIISLAEELARSREALASISIAQSLPPPPSTFVPVPVPPTSPALTLQTPAKHPNVPAVTRRETTEEWSMLVATPADGDQPRQITWSGTLG